MKPRLMRSLLAIVFAFACAIGIAGQQASEVTVTELKETIAKLEAVDRDPAAPPEVRELNRKFLAARRAQLRQILQDRLSALRAYLGNMRASLTSDEVRDVEQTIEKLQTDLSAVANNGGVVGNRDTPESTATKATVNGASDKSTPAESNANSSDGNSPVGTARNNSAPVAAAPPPTVNSRVAAATTTDDLPTPQNCDAYKANPKTFSLYEQYVCDLIERASARKSAGQTPIELTGPQFFNLSVILVAQKLRSSFLVDAQEARVDKQVGGGSSNSGSTSLVTKGGTPAVLGFAVENGALEREISGTTITFRGNPVGLVEAFQNKGFVSGFEDDSPATRFLRKTSVAFSFDTDRGSQPGIFTANKQQLSALSARFEFINRRDPRNRAYRNDWENFLAVNATPFLTTLVQSKDVLIERITGAPGTPIVEKWRDQALEDWYEETQSAITRAAPGNVESVLKAQLDKLPIDELSSETVTALTNFARQFGVYLEGRQRILDKVAKGTIATIEYTNKREVNAPDTSNFMGIYETAFGGKGDFTFNGSLTLFHQRPTVVRGGRVRDFQFAGQLDLPFGSVTSAGQYLLSVSGKYERLAEDASDFMGTVVPNTKGDIALGQVKLTIPIKGLGIRFPISVTFANRTELVKEKTVRGNFGFTFDLDTILARFKTFGK